MMFLPAKPTGVRAHVVEDGFGGVVHFAFERGVDEDEAEVGGEAGGEKAHLEFEDVRVEAAAGEAEDAREGKGRWR